MIGEHSHSIRVYYEDTDSGGVVYHANYLRFAERARTEWLRVAGFDHPTLLADFGVAFTVHRCEITFLAPARLDDELVVRTSMTGTQGARIRLQQVVARAAQPLASLLIELVLVDRRMRPVRPPKALRSLFSTAASA